MTRATESFDILLRVPLRIFNARKLVEGPMLRAFFPDDLWAFGEARRWAVE